MKYKYGYKVAIYHFKDMVHIISKVRIDSRDYSRVCSGSPLLLRLNMQQWLYYILRCLYSFLDSLLPGFQIRRKSASEKIIIRKASKGSIVMTKYSSQGRDFIPQIHSSSKEMSVNPIFISLEYLSFRINLSYCKQ